MTQRSGGKAVKWLGFLLAVMPATAIGQGAKAPCPPSDIIEKVLFAPVSTIVRVAEGSDNWPLTWGDDDAIYAAYGDGNGFKPRTDKKLSLGFAKILGFPPDFRGLNIRSPSGERTGDGPSGPKASGMIMVDGVLYMWARNTGNATIAWSDDHARTWKWGFRFTESFGCPTFLNFGRNYENARDRFVYVYSPDGPTAYEPYDRVILARVPRDRIFDPSAYEFFVKLDESGRPLWTRNFKKRGAVLNFPGHCERPEVVYNAGLKRYLMALGFNHRSGWGLFDAPEPWGPWTVAFLTESWDVPGTHSYRIPTKWISRDGKTMYLVFSGVSSKGYDAFCVRKMTLILKEK